MIRFSYVNLFLLAPLGLLIGAGIVLFFERKLIAISQKRLGISFMGRQGWAILPADVFKFLTKEISRHHSSTSFGTLGSLGLLTFWSLISSIFFLSSGHSRLECFDFSLLVFLAYANLSTLITMSLVFSSGSKFSSLASLRALTLAPLIELYFTSSLNFLILRSQSLSIEAFSFLDFGSFISSPFIGLTLFIYIIFEVRRAPFDHTEAESELVAGHLTEFGGRTLLAFFICEYIHVYFSIFLTIVFVVGINVNTLSPLAFYLFKF